MIFNYIKYITPTWYFNLKPNSHQGYFLKADQIKAADLQIDVDNKFKSKTARERDLSYRAFQSGFINKENKKSDFLDIWKRDKIPAHDEYRFLRKNFHQFWIIYVLILRLVTLKNPLKEISGFLRSFDAKKEPLEHPIVNYKYDSFKSKIVADQPLVSIIIPTLNRYKYLKDVFADLEKQTYKNFEVIVVDQTDPFQKEIYEGWSINLIYWFQEEKALWKARNDAIKTAKGDYVLLYDDDSRVNPEWIYEHLKCLDFYKADISSGVSLSVVGGKIPHHYSFFRWSDQLDTGNAMIKKDVFRKIGLFDRQFEKQRMGDGEFGLRAYLAGFRNVSNPKAKRIHLKIGSGGLRELGSWDSFRPTELFAPRPIPSVLYLYRKYFGCKAAIIAIMNSLPRSVIPYRLKSNKSGIIFLGLIYFILLSPLLVIQVKRSWNLADVKLKEGPKIEDFKGNP